MVYAPDNWVIIKIGGDCSSYKILAGWSGGYTSGSSWRMNSGITRVEQTESAYRFYGASGSCYECCKDSYCLRMNNAYIWEQLQNTYGDKVELMPENTNWLDIDWGLIK